MNSSNGHDPASRETLEELRNLNKNLKREARLSSRLSAANFILAFAMFVLGILQFAGQVFDMPDKKSGQWLIFSFVLIPIFGMIIYAFRKIIASENVERDPKKDEGH